MKERFEALKKGLLAEKESELNAYRSLLEERSMKERITEGVTLYPVEYLDARYNQFDDLILDFKINQDQTGKLFGANGKCNLFHSNSTELEEGIITFNRNGKLSLKIFSGEIPEWIKNGKIGLNAICDTRTFDVQLKTLNDLMERTSGIAHQFYHSETFVAKNENYQNNNSLNESQNKAVSAITSQTNFHIVHGPPGTGKTKTLVAAIELLLKNEKRILVSASTNAAVDHIAFELHQKGLPVLRYGNSFKIHEKVESITLNTRILNHPDMLVVARLKKDAEVVRKRINRYVRSFGKEEQEERRQLRNELKSLQRDMRNIESQIQSSTIEKSPIVCGTLIGLQHDEIRNQKFDVVLVDEAAQALEPAIWSIAQFAPQLIMAGDPLQLPPSLFSNEAIKSGLGISLIEKGIEFGQPTTLLDTQYRMNDKIMQFSNSKFYQNKLHSDKTVSTQKLKDDLYEPIEFIDTAGCGYDEVNDESGGISNPGEVDLLLKRLAELPSTNFLVGIISPYRKQVICLQDSLPQLASNIHTVDSFQGQERDIILISLVRSNTENEIGFLKDYRRMNVAMTRAKYKLIIIGDSATLGADAFYGDLLTYVETNGSYRSAWEYQGE